MVFDFDGTLADTFPRVARIFPRLARELHFRDPGPEGLVEMRGMSARQIMSHLGVAWWKVPVILWRARLLLSRDHSPVALFPGAVELLWALDEADLEWGIMTTNGLDLVRRTLRKSGAPEPGWLEAGIGLSGKTKHLRRFAQRIGADPSELLLVGDEVRDVESAKAAGVPMIGVPWGYNTSRALADAGLSRMCPSMDELRTAILGATDP